MEPDPKKDVQKYAKNTKKNNTRNYGCNIQFEVLLLLLETTMLLEEIMATAMQFSIRNKQFSRILLHIHT